MEKLETTVALKLHLEPVVTSQELSDAEEALSHVSDEPLDSFELEQLMYVFRLQRSCESASPIQKGSAILSNKEWDELWGDLEISPRALQLVQSIFDDKTEVGIAYDLKISVHTVHSYLIRIYRKFGVSSREQLLVYIFGKYLQQHRLPESQRSAGKRKRPAKLRVRL